MNLYCGLTRASSVAALAIAGWLATACDATVTSGPPAAEVSTPVESSTPAATETGDNPCDKFITEAEAQDVLGEPVEPDPDGSCRYNTPYSSSSYKAVLVHEESPLESPAAFEADVRKVASAVGTGDSFRAVPGIGDMAFSYHNEFQDYLLEIRTGNKALLVSVHLGEQIDPDRPKTDYSEEEKIAAKLASTALARIG